MYWNIQKQTTLSQAFWFVRDMWCHTIISLDRLYFAVSGYIQDFPTIFSISCFFRKYGNKAGAASPSQRDPPMAGNMTNEHPNSLFSLFRISATTSSLLSRSRFTTTCRYLIVCRIILTTNDITNIVPSAMVWLLTYDHPPKLCRPGLHFFKITFITQHLF